MSVAPLQTAKQSKTLSMFRKQIELKSLAYPAIAWSLFVILTALYFVFVCPWYYQNVCKILPIGHGLFVFYVVQNFFCAMCSDPGRYRPCQFSDRHEEVRLSQEMNVYTIKQVEFDTTICSSCLIVKPPRTHHCRTCGHCIDVMDHHCPWLSNCIGRRNYRYFLRFLVTLLIHMNVTFICSLCLIISLRTHFMQVKVWMGVILVICTGILAGPAGGLLGFHLILVSKSVTTFEQVTGKLIGLERSPFDRGLMKNWLVTCCTSVIPSFHRSAAVTRAMI